MLILRDFHCADCDAYWEELIDRTEDHTDCPSCGEPCRYIISAPGLATYSMMDRESQKAHLKERSIKHSQQMMKKEAGKWFPGNE